MKPFPPPVPAPSEFAPPAAPLPSPWAHAIHKPVFIAFLVCFVAQWLALLLGVVNPWPWAESLFWMLAAVTTLVALARRLPEQNVFVSALLIAAISLVIGILSARTAVPFGPRIFAGYLGAKVMGVPWTLPLVWIVVIVNSRGAARLIMRPWRKTTYYGFWVIGLTCLLSLAFDLGFEPFAARVKHYWFWQTSSNVPAWYSAPWVNFPGWFATSVAILGFTTPWLINKQPVKQPTDYHPLVLWLLLNFYFATGNALQLLWLAVGFNVLVSVIVSVYAVRGARW